MFPAWVMESFHKVVVMHPFEAGDRVRLGFALGGTHLPTELLKSFLTRCGGQAPI